MKKILALLMVAAMCFSLAACGGNESQTNNSGSQQEQSGNKAENESTVVTVENWENYLEFVVEMDDEPGFLYSRVYLKAKEGIVISAELNTRVEFSYNTYKQHYTKENDKEILGECEAIEDTYTYYFYMYGMQNREEYCEKLSGMNGCSTDTKTWFIIPNNFVITEIEGSIVAE